MSIRNIQDQYRNWQLVQPVPEGIALLQRFNQHVQSSQPWKIMIAEDLQGDSLITAPLSSGGYGFNAQWDDNFCGKLRWAAIASLDNERNIAGLAGSIAAMNGATAFQSILYDENHDKDDPNQGGGRLPAIIGNGQADNWFAKKQSTLAACVVLTAPGIPMLFMGQEFLEYRPFPNSNGYPEPIDWSRKDTYRGIWTLYRDMINLRLNSSNTRGLRGRNIHVLPVFSDNVMVYHRWDQGGPGDDVIVVCNFSNQRFQNYQVGMPRPGMWRVRFNSDSRDYDAYFDNWPSFDTDANGAALNGMPCSADISFGAYTCLVLSQD